MLVDILAKTPGVPTLAILGTRLKFMKGVPMKDLYETTMGA
jgi:hypothetical protein